MRTLVICFLGSISLAFCGCGPLSESAVLTGSPLAGKWTLNTAHSVGPNEKTCQCALCRKRELLGLPPLKTSMVSIVADDRSIVSALDDGGNPIDVPANTLTSSGSNVTLVLSSDFGTLPAGTYILSATDDRGYALSAGNEPTTSDGRIVSVSMVPN